MMVPFDHVNWHAYALERIASDHSGSLEGRESRRWCPDTVAVFWRAADASKRRSRHGGADVTHGHD
jgi:hypothetical protein